MKNKRILIINFTEGYRQIRLALEEEGYIVDILCPSDIHIEINPNNYCILFLIVVEGDMAVFKMARAIRNSGSYQNMPIIFLSDSNNETNRLTAFSAGADDYISKPFYPREIVARTQVMLKRIQLPENTTNKPTAL
ncbi:MAG: response regulator [Paludibacter sp.]|nr:response regulator [Paludibacter sp.]